MVQIMGHRGICGLEPENTLRSFQRAIALGIGWLECDVHFTEDGHLVLMHDNTVDRTTNGSGPVRSFTLEAIRALDAGKGERVPLLQELLDLAKGKVGLNIELKDETATEATVRLVEQNQMVGEVFLTGGAEVIKRVRRLNPAIRTELIFNEPPADGVTLSLAAGAKRISCHHQYLTKSLVQEAHEHGLDVIAWPPNTLEEMRAALACGADLICTDRADIAMELTQARSGGGPTG